MRLDYWLWEFEIAEMLSDSVTARLATTKLVSSLPSYSGLVSHDVIHQAFAARFWWCLPRSTTGHLQRRNQSSPGCSSPWSNAFLSCRTGCLGLRRKPRGRIGPCPRQFGMPLLAFPLLHRQAQGRCSDGSKRRLLITLPTSILPLEILWKSSFKQSRYGNL